MCFSGRAWSTVSVGTDGGFSVPLFNFDTASSVDGNVFPENTIQNFPVFTTITDSNGGSSLKVAGSLSSLGNMVRIQISAPEVVQTSNVFVNGFLMMKQIPEKA